MKPFPFPRPRVVLHVACMDRREFSHAVATSSYWALLMIERGRFSYRVGAESGESSPGSYVICPPGEAFHRKAVEGPMSFHYLLFRWPGGWGLPGGQRHLLDLERQRGALSALRTLSARSGEPGVLDWAACWLEELLRQPLFEAEFSPSPVRREPDRRMEQVKQALEENLCNPPALADLARRLRISPSRLSRWFADTYGLPPRKWHTRLRVTEARRLLLASDWTLDRIAEATGFFDAFHLGRVFKEQTGSSPGRFRRERQV